MRHRTPIDFTKLTDREVLMHLLPRVDTVEDDVDELDHNQEALSNAMAELQQNLVATEQRLSKRVDERFDAVDSHLSEQDKRLDRMVETRRRWPDGAKIAVTAVGSLCVSVGVALLLHLHF
ncbi:hypothetical protein [Alicyclobacillus sp. ALC3]|uniref:hypothetical protein n=1 Tax=Alicyclobacillus sp. ALC3 TaxID=2796143 RepID=UPI0023799C0F|nr:hypothetical protein [Alicyclobacillus sp. ALC3]WDL97790.1 hypothetical protein JC200_03405 [Alicyclobacillus sp. ALC3]